MKRVLILLLALFALLLAACAEEEEAPAARTATALVAEGEAVSFDTEDGITIRGHLFGDGDTAGSDHRDLISASVLDQRPVDIAEHIAHVTRIRLCLLATRAVGDDLDHLGTLACQINHPARCVG